MWYVYRGKNVTQGEIYYGVSQDPESRVDGSHCRGYTKAVQHWNCETDEIQWRLVSQHRSQPAASKAAHTAEREGRVPAGYVVIQTAGI